MYTYNQKESDEENHQDNHLHDIVNEAEAWRNSTLPT